MWSFSHFIPWSVGAQPATLFDQSGNTVDAFEIDDDLLGFAGLSLGWQTLVVQSHVKAKRAQILFAKAIHKSLAQLDSEPVNAYILRGLLPDQCTSLFVFQKPKIFWL
jgi:hypothetical protein